MQHTGVFATEDEIAQLRAAAARGWRPGQPMIVFSVREGMDRDRATMDAQTLCHAIAKDHGLPEIEGYYGIDLTGEFVTS